MDVTEWTVQHLLGRRTDLPCVVGDVFQRQPGTGRGSRSRRVTGLLNSSKKEKH